jgi:phosphopantothenoylcysteine decarboxylase/phosphopantothenate--cysteine ligase
MKNGKTGLLTGINVLLGVTGGIGAYKAAQLLRDFQREGAQVSVVMTESATRFISPLTMETLSGYPVGLDMFSLTEERTIGHIDRASWADVFVVAPATGNYLGKAAGGIADDLLTTIALALTCQVILAPAMNSRMWAHPAVKQNLKILVERGAIVVPPGEGKLACGEEGPGRLAEPERIVEGVVASLRGRDLSGIRVLITAGPTREAMDPVRFISNRSSGRMGYALAAAAVRRGAQVMIISGPVEIPAPATAKIKKVTTASEMLSGIEKALPETDWLIMAAAVADFAPSKARKDKIKKGTKQELTLELLRNPDILEAVRPLKGDRLFVGFAAETRNLVENARKKVKGKDLDLIVANDVSGEETGFESDENSGVILDQGDLAEEIPWMSKIQMADIILDAALRSWKAKSDKSG